MSELMADIAYNRGYEEGYLTAMLRAENRVALGLPLVHAPDENDDENDEDGG